MSFEILNSRPKARQPVRLQEVRELLEQLGEDPDNLTAKIDMAPANFRRYARDLGYKVRAKKIDNKNCYVWIDTPQPKPGKEKS